jgi:hypothetical protein
MAASLSDRTDCPRVCRDIEPAWSNHVSKDQHRLNRQLDRFTRRLPDWVRRSLHWLRQPSARWIRIPAGLALVVGGIFSVLPLLGLWMLPLGLLLLAQDLPFLRRPMRCGLVYLEHRSIRWKLRRQAKAAAAAAS